MQLLHNRQESTKDNNTKKSFLIYGLLGWILEIIWTGLGSLFAGDWRLVSRTYLWMLHIYGLAVFMEPVYRKITGCRWFFRGLIWAFIIFAIESCSGWLLKNLTGHCAWNYTGAAYNINGIIRLDYAPLWFATGLLFEKVYEYLEQNKKRLKYLDNCRGY